MMDTILNLGLNDETVEGLKKLTGNGRFAFDSYRRFIQMFGNVVLEIPKEEFEKEFEAVKHAKGVRLDTDLDEQDLRDVVGALQEGRLAQDAQGLPAGSVRAAARRPRRRVPLVEQPAREGVPAHLRHPGPHRHGRQRPDDGVRQQRRAIARPASASPATRRPARSEFYGEFLINAQGEDVVAGIRTPMPITELERRDAEGLQGAAGVHDAPREALQGHPGLRVHDPGREALHAADAVGQADRLRGGGHRHRSGGREADHARRRRCCWSIPRSLSQLLAPIFDPKEWKKIPTAAKGLPASPGAASGQVVFTAEDAVEWTDQGKKVVLVRKETVPDDIHGMFVSQGVLTATGGMTSHAAVVGRQMGKPAIVGASSLARGRGQQAADDRRPGRHAKGDVHLVRRADRRGEDREGRLEAERDPPGAERRDEGRGVRHLPALQPAARLGRQVPAPRHPRERRPARPGGARLRVRRPGHRPLPDRAHVLRGRPPADRPADDPGGQRGRSPQGAPRAAAAPARRLLRRLQGDARRAR